MAAVAGVWGWRADSEADPVGAPAIARAGIRVAGHDGGQRPRRDSVADDGARALTYGGAGFGSTAGVAGLAVGAVVLTPASCWLYRVFERRRRQAPRTGDQGAT